MSSYISADMRRLVVTRARGRCEYCLIHEADTFLGCVIDHVISEKHGGDTQSENLALACVFCNRYKGTDVGSISRRTGQLVSFFNPRSDRWDEHFRIDDLRIVGLTDIGEATARLFRFNDPERLIEREALRSIGRFPSASVDQDRSDS